MKNLSETKIGKVISLVSSSTLVRSSGVYTISSFINAALPLLLLPILTRRLTPVDYGIVAMFQVLITLIYPFVGMNLEGAISRKYFDKDETDFPAYIGTCFALVLGSLFIVSLIFWGFTNYIQVATQIPKPWLKYALLVVGCQFVTTVLLVLYQVRIQSFKYGLVQIGQSTLNVALTILFVVILKKTYDGRLESLIITGVVFAIISFIILVRTKQIRFEIIKKDVVHALKFGVPLIPHAIGGMLFTAIDRFFLTNLVGLEQTGNYAVAFQIGQVISLLTIAFNNAYVPWLFENLNKDSIAVKNKLVKFTYLYFVLLIIFAILLLVFFPLAVKILVGHQFRSTGTYATFIVFGLVFQGFYFMVTNYIMYARKTHIQAAVTISVGLLKIPLTYFLIVWFGAVGASVSFCLSYLIFFIATWVLSAKAYPMPWNIFTLFKTKGTFANE